MHDGHGVTVAVGGKGLLAEVQSGEELLVALLGIGLHVVEKLAALRDQLQESAAGRGVLLVNREVVRQVHDALGHQGDLVVGAAGVGVVDLVIREVNGAFAH